MANCYNCKNRAFDVGNSFIGCKKKQQVITNPSEDKECYESSVLHNIFDQILGDFRNGKPQTSY